MNRPKRLAVLTTGRQDWGLLRPLCEALAADEAFELLLVAGGMACSAAFGSMAQHMRQQGFRLAAELPWPVEGSDAAVQASRALETVAETLEVLHPDALVLLGDRYETAAAALAATLRTVPIVHLYGGEETEGAFDNSFRHAITKLSHLHLVAHEVYAGRVIQMGEDPAAVHVVGSLAVDTLHRRDLPSRRELEAALGIELQPPVGVVTVHPTTLGDGPDAEGDELEAVVAAMEAVPATWVVTLPNADPGGDRIRATLLAFAGGRPNAVAVPALGEERYLGLLKIADVVLGNSSSGMTEAPALAVPTVNVGDRQRGRLRCPSILDVPPEAGVVIAAVRHSLEAEFRQSLREMASLFGGPGATDRIMGVLRRWHPLSPPRKVFRTWRGTQVPGAATSSGTNGDEDCRTS